MVKGKSAIKNLICIVAAGILLFSRSAYFVTSDEEKACVQLVKYTLKLNNTR